MNDKRNPNISRGDGETLSSYTGRCDEYLSKLEWQSEGHRMWYTHKNPYGCWICELLQISRELRDCIVLPERDFTEVEENTARCQLCDNIICTCDTDKYDQVG